MMDLFKFISLLFALVMANGVLMPTMGSPTRDTHGNVLWDKIWEHIKADDRLLQQTRANSTHPSSNSRNGLPLAGDGKQWVALLQKVLEGRVQPTGPTTVTTTTKTSTTPVVKSRETIDVQKLLRFITKSNTDLNNDQWMSLLKFILSSETMKEKTTVANHQSAPLPTTAATNANDLKNKNEMDGGDWAQRLQKLLNKYSTEKGEKDTPKPDNTPGDIVSITTLPPKQPSGSISDEQWQFLLKQYLYGNLKQKDNNLEFSTSTSTPTTKTTTPTTSDISDERWNLLLDQYLMGNLNQKDKLDIPKPSSAPSTKTPALTTPSSISDEQWQLVLEQYLNGNRNKKNTKLNTLTPSSSPSTKNTPTAPESNISDEQWKFMLDQYLNENSLQKESNSESPTPFTDIAKTKASDISDEQWETLLKQYLGENKKYKKRDASTPTSTPSTPTATTANGHVTTINYERETPDEQWERSLQQALDESPRQKDSKLEFETTTDATQAPSTASLGDDKEWRHLLEQTLNAESQQPTTKPQHISLQNKVVGTPPSNTRDANKLTDEEWTRLLDDMLEKYDSNSKPTMHPSNKLGKSSTSQDEVTTTPTTGTGSTSHKPVTDEGISQRKGDAPSKSTTAQNNGETTDEEWENALKLILDDGDADMNENTPSSPPPYKKTGHTILPKEPRADKMLSIEKIEKKEDENKYMYMILAVAGGAFLVFLIILIILVICHKRKVLCWSKKETHSTILNSDLNRFDLQVIRPSKENMNAFLYGIPAFDDVTHRY